MTKLTLNIDLNNNNAVALLNYLKSLEFISFDDSIDLSSDQKRAVDKALNQLRNKQGITHEEAMQQLKTKFPNLY